MNDLEFITKTEIRKFQKTSGGVSQAISALVALGYSQSQAALALAKLDTSQDVQSLIKQALRLIAGGKL